MGRKARWSAEIGLGIAALCLAVLFARLGFWQIGRAAEKEALASAAAAGARLPAITFETAVGSADELRFRKAILRGSFEALHQLFIDNQTNHGRAGYHVITPLVITPLRLAHSGRRILVNRGWVPMGPDREHLPAIEAPAGEIELRGVLDRPPAPRFAIDRLSRPGPEWGRRWAYLDLGYFVRSTGLSVEPYVMLLDPGAPYGFVREWPRLQGRHHRHLSYAGQWFLLAGVTVSAYLALWRSRRRTSP
ncbi:MAG: SURF1 family protein [Gammaproteobacteria bacterium]